MPAIPIRKFRMAPSSPYYASVLRLGAGFFCVFMAFNTTQALISTLTSDKTLAYATLGVLYGIFTMTSFIAPKLVDLMGPRIAITVGAIPYVLFVFANIYPVWGTLLPASAGVGFGAAILWTGQGIYLSRCAVRDAALTGDSVDVCTSKMNGTFWTLFQFNAAVGLVMSSIILGQAQSGAFSLKSAVTWMFIGFGALGVFGVSVFFSLTDAPPMKSGEGVSVVSDEEDGIDKDEKKGGASFYDTLQLIGSSRAMQLLLPVIFYCGASLGFFNATFPLIYQDPDVNTQTGLLPSSYVGYQAATFYLFNSFFSFAWGKTVTNWGRRPLFLVTFITSTVFFGVLLLKSMGIIQIEHQSAGAYILVFGLAISFAAGDSVLESQIPAIIQSPSFFPVERDRDAANSVLRMMQSLGYCAYFGLSIGLQGASGGSTLQIILLFALMFVALACVWACDVYVRSVDGGKVDSAAEYTQVKGTDE